MDVFEYSSVSDAEWQQILSELTQYERSFLEGKPLSEAYKAGFAMAKRDRAYGEAAEKGQIN
jgi:hypothetical protein